ncbi:MAG: hypothetical protein JWQ87_623 [Candidatus Sulfotelmatobacter sp.]|nr:hypothetical protein [Candidatus Sulfotelmatobacter sp.]
MPRREAHREKKFSILKVPAAWFLVTASMVGAAGIEPATTGLEIRCSIRLSYAPSTTYGLPYSTGGRFGGSWDRRITYRKLTTKLSSAGGLDGVGRQLHDSSHSRNNDADTDSDESHWTTTCLSLGSLVHVGRDKMET